MSLRVLYVCTGNVCRSPLAELLLRAWLPGQPADFVSSAGTEALVGQGIDRSTASVLGQLGIDPTRHRARQLEPWMATHADLVLTAEHSHRDAIIADVPTALRRTFTMKEFARLSRRLRPGVGEPHEVIAVLAAIRASDGPAKPGSDDMPDPYLGSINQARLIARQVNESVQATIAALRLDGSAETVPAHRPGPRPRPAPPGPADTVAPTVGTRPRPSPNRPQPR